jgi:hypothetical protein
MTENHNSISFASNLLTPQRLLMRGRTKEMAYKNESETRTSWVEYAQMGVLDQ